MIAQSPPRPPADCNCKTRRGEGGAEGGIHETRVAAEGAGWGRGRSTGLCWWDQRRRLARGGPPCGCLPRRQTTGPAHSKALLKRACAHFSVRAQCIDSGVSSMRLGCHSRIRGIRGGRVPNAYVPVSVSMCHWWVAFCLI
jgi:hypothetical protein